MHLMDESSFLLRVFHVTVELSLGLYWIAIETQRSKWKDLLELELKVLRTEVKMRSEWISLKILCIKAIEMPLLTGSGWMMHLKD